MDYKLTKKQANELIENKLLHYFGVNPQSATYEQYYRAVAMILRDMMGRGRAEFSELGKKNNAKRICYLSMEFLMGRSLKNTLYNLNLLDVFTDALSDHNIDINRLFCEEPDAGLGNGGLGRLAACYLDGLATQGYPARGYSILYEYGFFRQKLVDGWQTEIPDSWLPGGEVWLVNREESSVEVMFEGQVKDVWEGQFHHVEIENPTVIKAVPFDMFVAGKDGKGISVLRLWSAKAPGIDLSSLNQGDYMRAVERSAMAEVISKVLYPSDDHPEGKSLRLRQQYFLVSASVQDIVRHHLHIYGTVENLPDKVAIHINDTHPTLAIPELMRILLDECGYGWDEAWSITNRTVAYTNHTVMKEALECWGEDLVRRLMPRVYEIIKEIDNRFRYYVWTATGDSDYVERTAIISNGVVRMANLCVAACHSVNGVSALHSQILKDSVFKDFYNLTPGKFKNVTNGIAHRRWLCQANAGLTGYLRELIGPGFETDASLLEGMLKYKDDSAVLEDIRKIKLANKESFAAYMNRTAGVKIDPDTIFDVQVKRLHEYKRQHLNAYNILARYLEIKENPGGDYIPRTYIFGAKAAPSYYMAKKIISFIVALGEMINNDPEVNKLLKIVYVEDYNVTAAERLVPAADISEQISLAGTEASGTGNMKLMINGAITLGTMDGANIEIHDAVGEDNIIIFGMNTQEVEDLKRAGYNANSYYFNNEDIRRIIDFINSNAISGKHFPELGSAMLGNDRYMVLADFADYKNAQKKSDALYRDSEKWARMSLINTAKAGIFAADRSVNDYARDIWNASPAFTRKTGK